MRIQLVSWMAFLAPVLAIAAPSSLDKLAAPAQTTRDRAAKELRASFVPVSKEHWSPLLQSLKKGQTEPAVLAILKTFDVQATLRSPRQKSPSGGPIWDDGMSDIADYRLDAQWSLRAEYDMTAERLYNFSLYKSIPYVWVDPPKGFTGSWVVYYANGVPAFRIEYQNGQYNGTFTQYDSDGSRKHVQHYTQSRMDGTDRWYR